MFDFFSEIIEFLGQVVFWLTFVVEFIVHGLARIPAVTAQLGTLITSIPAPLSALILFLLGILIFEFIRGRSS